MGSPFFTERADLPLECPRVARLLVKLPVGLCHGRGAHQAFEVDVLPRPVALAFPDSIAHPCGIHAGIDYEMSDVDISRSEFPRGALRDCAEPKLRGCERCVSDSAAETGGAAGEENRSPPSRQHQARSFPAGDESGVAGHLPDLAEHAVSRFEQREVYVCADIENADLERRLAVGVLQESGEVVFLSRVERSRRDSPAICLDLCDQWRELGALAPSRESDE